MVTPLWLHKGHVGALVWHIMQCQRLLLVLLIFSIRLCAFSGPVLSKFNQVHQIHISSFRNNAITETCRCLRFTFTKYLTKCHMHTKLKRHTGPQHQMWFKNVTMPNTKTKPNGDLKNSDRRTPWKIETSKRTWNCLKSVFSSIWHELACRILSALVPRRRLLRWLSIKKIVQVADQVMCVAVMAPCHAQP